MAIEAPLEPRTKDLGGGFLVRRLLPAFPRQAVGPFVFFDHFGPVTVRPADNFDVRPHPHIGLATVTYLFEGAMLHRDSLGVVQRIEPGAINWMTAGRGVVHSERSPDDFRAAGGRINGIQLWVALPTECEEIPPTFVHHPKNTLPEFQRGNVQIKLLLGEILGELSPVKVHSDLFYLEAKIPAGEKFLLPVNGREAAVYVASGRIRVGERSLSEYEMAVAKPGDDIEVTAESDARLMFLGGSPVGERHIYWNFVSSSKDKIEEAKREWAGGPRRESGRFHPVPGDDNEHIPLPE